MNEISGQVLGQPKAWQCPRCDEWVIEDKPSWICRKCKDVYPECGRDFCQCCGDCLACYGEDCSEHGCHKCSVWENDPL